LSGGLATFAGSVRAADRQGAPSGQAIRIVGADLQADAQGVLYWSEHRLLVVADLHLEKGSSFAVRGSLLPPYDTGDTLARLGRLIRHYDPRAVIALGDNFHDGDGAARLSQQDRDGLADSQRGRDWIWISGNHDPEPMDGIGGDFAISFSLGSLSFRHIPSADGEGVISGHLHPVAIVPAQGRGVRRRCFASDGMRMVMPAFGAYAGGLNVRHRAFTKVFERPFTAHVMGADRVHAIASAHCAPDWR
jgi:DNA ligase-associated metallophosphoesterase